MNNKMYLLFKDVYLQKDNLYNLYINKYLQVYGVTNDNNLFCFDTNTGKVEWKVKIFKGEIHGIDHNPKRNIVVSYSLMGEMLLFKP